MSIDTFLQIVILQTTDSTAVWLIFAFIVLIALIAAAIVSSSKDKPAKPKRPTILVCGATGVGKSTLINTVLGEELAKVGGGEPVTQETERIATDSSEFVFWDSKGLEVLDASQTYLLLMSDLLRLRFGLDPSEQIDLVLMCIQEPQGRVDDAHLEIAGLCQDLGIPFAIALTKKEGNIELETFVRKTFVKAVFVRELRSRAATYSTFTLPAEGVMELSQDIRAVAAKNRILGRRRLKRGRSAQALAISARRLAVMAGKEDLVTTNDLAWTGFASEAWLRLGMQGYKWEKLIKEEREHIKRLMVPGYLKRKINTRFDDGKIDAAISRRLIPVLMRRFADESGKLNASDLRQVIFEAFTWLGENRPYRSRF